jgi:4-methylaminobutanoate oxidase (formaldehyde-forming)
MPTDVAVTVYTALMAVGGVTNAGYRAIETLRLEKGYRAWGAEIGPDHTPVEAGLAWACKTASDIPFLGRDALIAQKSGVKKRLAGFSVHDPDITLLGRETIYRDGVRVGWLASGGYGHTVGRAIGYGYIRHADGVDSAFMQAGEYTLDVASMRVPAQLHLEPLYDPKSLKIKA